MQIRSVILRGVRNFEDFDRSFEDSWTGTVADALLLIGPNGSGKTTVLDAIAEVWVLLEYHLRTAVDTTLRAPRSSLVLPRGFDGFAAIEVLGFESASLWICTGLETTCLPFLASQPACHRVASLVVSPDGQRQFVYMPPDAIQENGSVSMHWHLEWSQRLNENILGKRSDLPNMVYLESETRLLQRLREEEFEVTREPEEFKWLARYQPTSHRKGSIQNYLYNLKVVDDVAFAAVVEQINRFLTGKRLHGFDPRSGQMLVAVDGGARHPIEQLSSGEKQVLLMLAAITRWLQPGGVVLIDEPDLHLHVSLATAFVSHLRRMVAAQKGQLILASHALDLRRQFTASHLVRLGQLNGEEAAE